MVKELEDDQRSVLTQGEFLRTLALAGLGVLGIGALTGCSPSNGSSEGQASTGGGNATQISWDKEVDVLVVGSGTAAIAAFLQSATLLTLRFC